MQALIFGSPGVGKGTQAKLIAKKLNLKHISTGDLLREIIKQESDLGKQIQSLIDKGNYVPDDMIGKIVKESLNKNKCNFILDGYPRTLPQIGVLDKILEELEIPFPKVIILEADDEIIIKRLTSRRSCNNCCGIISIENETEPDICPHCKSDKGFTRREDDKKEVISKRLNIYHQTTEPVVEHFRNLDQAIIIDGTEEMEVVTDKIISRLTD